MWKILQYNQPEDWVIATGITTSVRDFVRLSFRELGIILAFTGTGIKEQGYIKEINHARFLAKTGNICPYQLEDILVKVNPRYFRPTEVELLIGDASKANNKLNWQPKYDLKALCSEMVNADLASFKKEQILKNAGYLSTDESYY